MNSKLDPRYDFTFCETLISCEGTMCLLRVHTVELHQSVKNYKNINMTKYHKKKKKHIPNLTFKRHLKTKTYLFKKTI